MYADNEDNYAEYDVSDYDRDDGDFYKTFDGEDPNPYKCPSLNFILQLTTQEWADIKFPGKNSLKPYHWTNILFDKLRCSEFSLPCPFAFEDKKFYNSNSSDACFKIFGRCSECETYIEGICPNNYSFESSEISINIRTYDTKEINHAQNTRVESAS